MDDGSFVKHIACGECGSSDGNALYDTGAQHCFVCYAHKFAGEGTETMETEAKQPTRLEMYGEIDSIPDRRISKATCKKFGVTTGPDTHYYPYYDKDSGALVACKRRVVSKKAFSWSGDRSTMGLFGQNTCRAGGKYITIVEGEIDALSVSEMFERKWDVVSIPDGASAAKLIKENLEFLESYQSIVLCFDQDAAGEKGVKAVRDLFSPNKVKIVTLPEKDPNEMLKAAKVREFVSAWWDAKSYLPAGIVKVSETWDAIKEYRDTPHHSYPWQGLTDMLMGQRKKEINIWAAETGIGKSQTMRELQDHLIRTTPGVVGCLMLEESVAKTTLGWMSFHAGRPLHKELNSIPDEELQKYWEAATSGDRLVLLDHKGWGNDIDNLKARIRYMKHAFGCDYIFLDHLHIALSSVKGATGDWAGIDDLVTDFTRLVQELDICLHLVCHTSGDRSLRGSKGISKLADAVIFLERDKHHEDPEIANTTAVIVDKNRWAGDSGTACYLRYDNNTGRMTECDKPEALVVPDEF